MSLLRVLPDWERYDFELELKRQWRIPGVDCATCGAQWADAATIYASTSLEDLENSVSFIAPRNVPLDEFLALRNAVESANPEILELPPGTQFGRLVGEIHGQCTDLAVFPIASVLISLKAFKRLASVLEMPATVAVNCLNNDESTDTILELDLPLLGNLTNPTITGSPDPCASCGRVGKSWPTDPVVEVAERNASVNLFRLRNFSTMIIASEKFVQTYKKLGMRGLKFQWLASN